MLEFTVIAYVVTVACGFGLAVLSIVLNGNDYEVDATTKNTLS